MTSNGRNDLMPMTAQEKMEWVAPKISLMGAGDTEGKITNKFEEKIVGTGGINGTVYAGAS